MDTQANNTQGLTAPEPSPNGCQDGRRNNRGTVGNSGGKAGRSGPPGHTHNLKHGKHAYAFTAVGTLPKETPREIRSVVNSLNRLRTRLRKLVAPSGALTIGQDALISAVIRYELSARLAMNWLASEKLPFSERLAGLKQIEASSTARDKALRALRLDPSTVAKPDPLAGFYEARDRLAALSAQQTTPMHSRGDGTAGQAQTAAPAPDAADGQPSDSTGGAL
jgi:hypothetical protein